jgi:membrane associated rhomboid family serine protease
MTPWVKRILFANVAMYLLILASPAVGNVLMFVPALLPTRPWTVVTYMFLHAGLWHIGFNMLALYFFGPAVETRLGGRHFVGLYLSSGIMGAVLSIPFTPHAAIVGASGAVFGVMLAFARYWPRQRIYIWGVLPIEARWMVILMTAFSLWAGFGGAQSGVAHFAHLGGFLGGFLYLKWMDWRSPARRFKQKAQVVPPPPRDPDQALERWKRIRREDIHPVNRDEVDRLLDKISREGVKSLTPDERALLERFAGR